VPGITEFSFPASIYRAAAALPNRRKRITPHPEKEKPSLETAKKGRKPSAAGAFCEFEHKQLGVCLLENGVQEECEGGLASIRLSAWGGHGRCCPVPRRRAPSSQESRSFSLRLSADPPECLQLFLAGRRRAVRGARSCWASGEARGSEQSTLQAWCLGEGRERGL